MKNYFYAALLILFTSCEKENTPLTIENYLSEKSVSKIITNPDGTKVFFLSGIPDPDQDPMRCSISYLYQISCTDGERNLYFENLKYIGDITVDNNCNLYACVRNRIVKFTPPHDSTSVLNSPSYFSTIAADTSGKLWAGTYGGGGLYYFDKYAWHHYTNRNSSLTGNNISAIETGKNNDVWIAVSGDTCSLTCVSQGIWKTYEWKELSDENVTYISYLSVDKNGTAWVYYHTDSYKLATLDKNGVFTIQTPAFLADKSATNLSSDYAGNIIISVYKENKSQVYMHNGSVWKELALGKEYTQIFDVSIDAKNNVWIGTFEGADKCSLQFVQN